MPDFDDSNVGDALLDKVRAFTESLSEQERSMFAALLAPGITAVWESNDEVVGFAAPSDGVQWQASTLGDHLSAAVRRRHLRIVESEFPADD